MDNKSMEYIENTFMEYILDNINTDNFLENIKNALTAISYGDMTTTYEFHFDVSLSNFTGFDDFFGFRIFPKIDDLFIFCNDFVNMDNNNELTYKDLCKRWNEIKNWHIEIDYALFDRNNINFNVKEMMALLLNEIGRVIFSNDIIERLYYIYKESEIKFNGIDSAVQKTIFDIYALPIAIICMQREWYNPTRTEIEPNVQYIGNKSINEYEYGVFLVDALNKIIKRYGALYDHKNKYDDETINTMDWVHKVINNESYRAEHLKDDLYYTCCKYRSIYYKSLTIAILNKLGYKLRERYTGMATENNIELLMDNSFITDYSTYQDAMEAIKIDKTIDRYRKSTIATEGFGKRKKKYRVQLPSQYDIDSIYIEIDKMDNHHDRIFVLDLIYDAMNKVDMFEESIVGDPMLERKWAGKIATMRKELETQRQKVFAKNNFGSQNNQYRMFVKLPPEAKDYEG